jgi:hypothetical protein
MAEGLDDNRLQSILSMLFLIRVIAAGLDEIEFQFILAGFKDNKSTADVLFDK